MATISPTTTSNGRLTREVNITVDTGYIAALPNHHDDELRRYRKRRRRLCLWGAVMPTRAPRHRPPQITPQHRQVIERERGSASSRGYDRTWQRLRLAVLAEEPLCRFCYAAGQVTPAREVDHIETIRDRPDLRLVRSNLRPLCTPCHSARTARETRR